MPKISKYRVLGAVPSGDCFSGISKNGAMQHYSYEAMIDFVANEVLAKEDVNVERVVTKTAIPFLNLDAGASQKMVNEAIISKLQALENA